MAAEVTGLVDAKTVQRPLYAGNAIATVAMEARRAVISVRTTAFDAAEKGAAGNVEKLALSRLERMSFVDFAETKSDRPVLTEARIVCSAAAASRTARTSPPTRAALRRARRRDGGEPRRGRRGLRPERPPGRPDRQGRGAGSSTSPSASPAPSSTSPA
jgi:hypothetical protein